MTTPTTSPVAGYAVYLEFVRPGITTQVILMPEATGSSHNRSRIVMYRRRLTKLQRKTWKASTAGTSSFEMISGAASGVAVTRDEIVSRLTHFTLPLLRSLAMEDRAYVLYGKPIVVEVTAEDVEQARILKTPYKVLGRIMKTRKALGYPNDIVHWAMGESKPMASSVTTPGGTLAF